MAMAAVESPMDRLVKGLRNRSRDLRGLVEKLEIGQHSLLSYRALSKYVHMYSTSNLYFVFVLM